MGWWSRVAGLLTRAPDPSWLHPYYLAHMGWPGPLSAADEPVTPATAQSQATCYAALSLISGALAAPTWDVVATSASGGRRIDRTSAAAKALTTLDYSEREGVVWDTWATGNGFIRHWRNNLGGRSELERLVASQMTILADADGMTGYRYMDPYSGKQVDFAASDIIHVRCRTLGLWPVVGVPPLLSGKDAIGLALAIQRYQGSALANASLPLGYLTTASKIDPQKAMEIGRRWAENYAGTAQAGKTAVLEQGLEYHTVETKSFADLQMAEASRLAAREVAKLFGLTSAILGGGDEVNRSTAGVEVELAYRTCLFPASVRVADQVGRQLLSEAERAAGLSVAIDLQGWLRGSGQILADMLSKLVLANVLAPDEARAFINLPVAPNGTGANLLRPANMVPADQPLPAPPPPAPAAAAAPPPPALTVIVGGRGLPHDPEPAEDAAEALSDLREAPPAPPPAPSGLTPALVGEALRVSNARLLADAEARSQAWMADLETLVTAAEEGLEVELIAPQDQASVQPLGTSSEPPAEAPAPPPGSAQPLGRSPQEGDWMARLTALYDAGADGEELMEFLEEESRREEVA
jgi:HK97 family phage portal protein